jgi:pentatricopeptide repeat protein
VDVYSQLRAQGFQLERHVFHVVLEVFLKLGRWQDALSVMDDMTAQVVPCIASATTASVMHTNR